MLQMSLLRLVFIGLQEADSKQILSALFRTPHFYQGGYASGLVTLIQTDFRAVPKPRPEDARFARAPKQSTTPEETRNWIVLAVDGHSRNADSINESLRNPKFQHPSKFWDEK